MTPQAQVDRQFWRGRAVLLTGHTGFKGAWLALWLQSLGARVSGLAPGPPTEPSLYALARVGAGMERELAIDVRDGPALREALRAARPEVVLHLAAQPMVRLSLREPELTYAVNVMGTVGVLEAVRVAGASVRAVVVVTSDKCYANPAAYGANPRGEVHRFVETDPLGGHDPYSSSKACAELVTAAYRDSFFAGGGAGADGGGGVDGDARAGRRGGGASGGADGGGGVDGDAGAGPRGGGAGVRVASARAGNVIGGGDFGEDRLVPDVLRAHIAGRAVRVRNPQAVRPWQHVLNPLSGYLTLAQRLCESDGDRWARPFNFGPPAEDARPVREVVERLNGLLGQGAPAERDRGANPPEAMRLELDSSAAERELRWRAAWDLDEALARVAAWHTAHLRGEDARAVSLEQIAAFVCRK